MQSNASAEAAFDVAVRPPTWREKVIGVGPNAAEALILPSEPSIEAPVGKLEVIENVPDVQEKVDHNAVCNTKNAKLCRKEVPS